MRPRVALAVALLVVLAGCGGPADGPAATERRTLGSAPTPTCAPASATSLDPPAPSPTGTPDSDPEIGVSGAILEFDADAVFARVRNLTGTTARPPDLLHVTRVRSQGPFVLEASPFERRLGFGPVPIDVAGYAVPGGRVVLDVSLNRTERELTLAHEFYHVVAFQRYPGWFESGPPRTSHALEVERSVSEGTADYVQQGYWRRHLADRVASPTRRMTARYRRASPSLRRLLGRYYFGYRYVTARVDSPRELATVYRHPPRSMEELIHRLPPGSEPPAPLRVTVRGCREWERNGTDVRGELFVRHALQVGVEDAAAVRGATGWANDTVVRFDDRSATGHVWLVRFDDATNATEFQAVLGEALDARAQPTGSGWATDGVRYRVLRVSNRSVALVVGPDRFVDGATVEGGDGAVTVRVP